VTWCMGISCPISCGPTHWAHQRIPRGRAWASLLRSALQLYHHRRVGHRLIIRAIPSPERLAQKGIVAIQLFAMATKWVSASCSTAARADALWQAD
jgi:hypothetical protein